MAASDGFPTLTRRPTLALATLCLLYGAQGMPDGFVRIGLKTFLVDRGASDAEIGPLLAMISWPWAVKWVWGPVIDRFSNSAMGRRRPWVLLAQAGMVLVLAGTALLGDVSERIKLLGVMILLVNVFAALQDVAVDALAIDVLPPEKRGLANGLMQGAMFVGSFIGGRVLGGLLLTYGLNAAIAAEVAILLGVMSVPFLLRERPGDRLVSVRQVQRDGPASAGGVWGRLRQAFGVRSSQWAAALALSSLLAYGAYVVFWPAYLQRTLGWSGEEVQQLEATFALGFGLTGSVLGGVLGSLVGTRRMTAIASLLLIGVWFGHWLADWSSRPLVVALFVAQSFCVGLLRVAMFSLFMNLVWSAVAGTQFSAYMALLNLSQGLGSKFAGVLTETFSVRQAFLVLAAVQAVPLLLLLGIDESQTRRELGDGNDGDGNDDAPTTPDE